MAIIRTKQERRFTTISNKVYADNHLSFQAMGLLSYLLSKPDNWSVSPSHLAKVTEHSAKKTARSGIYKIIKELKDNGYITTVKRASGEMDYYVFDEPNSVDSNQLDCTENEPDLHNTHQAICTKNDPDLHKPDLHKPDLPKNTLINTDNKQRLISNNSSSKKKFSDEDLRLAQWIFSKVLEVSKHAKANLDKWADTIRLMRERDNLTHKQIAEVFYFANSDSFWRTNILSPIKLREQFAQLEAKLNQGVSGNDYSKPSEGTRPDFGEHADQSQFPAHIRIKSNDVPTVKRSKTAFQRQHLERFSPTNMDRAREFVR
ncbi:hypothetical protein [Vibrio astriarenae]|uniref:hypothetical protein n=1 Tax=Vibrio astriarenae TaxID=1481923 RepID=UPI0037357671